MVAGPRLSREDLERLYQTLGPRVQAYLLRLVGDPAAAADVLQETFVRLLQAPPGQASQAELRAYVYRAAHSRAMDHLRSRRRRAEDSEPFDAPSSASLADSMTVEQDIERAFAELESRDRALLWLAYVEEMRHNEIARSLGVGTLSVKVLLFRARKRFEKVLRRRGLSPEIAR